MNGPAALALLRSQPKVAIATHGFVTRGLALRDAVGTHCTLTCSQLNQSSIFKIEVTAGAGDWYIPFIQGGARYCDVPQGEANGTIVVTYPMNGCALEVRSLGGNHRFYHDSDGNSMPGNPGGVLEIRVTADAYEGPNATARFKSMRYFGPDKPNQGGYEHGIFCVKVGTKWEVYSSATIVLNMYNEDLQLIRRDGFQVKDEVPAFLGSFDD